MPSSLCKRAVISSSMLLSPFPLELLPVFVLLGLFAVGKTQGMLFFVQWLQGWRLSQRTLRLWHIKQLLTDDMAENLRNEPWALATRSP